MRRCQRSSAGAGAPEPSAARATLWPKVTEFSSVCQVRARLGPAAQRRRRTTWSRWATSRRTDSTVKR